jgi:formyl-CoA transferase
MLEDPHTAARGLVIDYEHPTLGPMKGIAHPIVFNGAPRSVETAPPLHGEHTRQILAAAGYSAEKIEEMAASSVIVA